MRIAVIGSGAVGCLYGARLARAGQDVHFLMRRDLDAVRRNGLMIHGPDYVLNIAANAHATSDDIGPVDLVICALKTTALDVAQSLIRPCVTPDTDILALMNGLGVEERFAEWFGPDNIFGGLAFVCSNRGEPGVVYHHGYGRVAFGHYHDDQARAKKLADLFAAAGFVTSVAPSLRQGRWVKLVWNIPFSTLAVSAGAVPTSRIMEDEGLRRLAESLMRETITAGNADGCHIDVEPLIKKMFDNTSTMGDYRPSMLVDYESRNPLEVESILGEPARRAAAMNVPVPHIEMQYRLVAFLDRLNRGEVSR
jgi:2-dehydropantoate 2-reductase